MWHHLSSRFEKNLLNTWPHAVLYLHMYVHWKPLPTEGLLISTSATLTFDTMCPHLWEWTCGVCSRNLHPPIPQWCLVSVVVHCISRSKITNLYTHLQELLHPKWKNMVMNEWKATKVQMYVQPFFPERTYWSLTPQLDTVVKTLRLRGNPWRLYRAKHLPSQNWTYGDTGFFTVAKLAILWLAWSYLHLLWFI